MASILFGVAIIPAQAASLFESLLEFQNERRQSQSIEADSKTILGRKGEQTELDSVLKERYERDAILDSRISCRTCGARCHRIDAIHCFACGEKL